MLSIVVIFERRQVYIQRHTFSTLVYALVTQLSTTSKHQYVILKCKLVKESEKESSCKCEERGGREKERVKQEFSLQMLSILCINLRNECEMACAQKGSDACYSPPSNIRVSMENAYVNQANAKGIHSWIVQWFIVHHLSFIASVVSAAAAVHVCVCANCRLKEQN